MTINLSFAYCDKCGRGTQATPYATMTLCEQCQEEEAGYYHNMMLDSMQDEGGENGDC